MITIFAWMWITAQTSRTPPVFKPVGTSGAQQAMLYVEPLPTLGGQLEVQMIGVGQEAPLILPTDREVALEVRTGNAIVTTDGERIEHAAGDIWVVPLHARVKIEASGEATVLRAMYFTKAAAGR
jgi:gentisate 1,2-dioxygenase